MPCKMTCHLTSSIKPGSQSGELSVAGADLNEVLLGEFKCSFSQNSLRVTGEFFCHFCDAFNPYYGLQTILGILNIALSYD